MAPQAGKLFLALAALVALPLAGCLGGGGSGPAGTLTRSAVFDLTTAAESSAYDDESYGGEDDDYADDEWQMTRKFVADAFATSFRYAHEGGTVDVADVQVTFTDEQMHERTVGLSRFTDLETLQEGDAVTVDGVALTSGIELRDGSRVLAARQGRDVAWLRGEDGTPIPLAVEPGATARWSFEETLGYHTGFDHFAYVDTYDDGDFNCEEGSDGEMECRYESHEVTEEIIVDDASLEGGAGVAGNLELTARRAGTGLGLALDLEGNFNSTVLADADVERRHTEDGVTEKHSSPFGADLAVEGDGDLSADIRFDAERNYTRLSGEGHVEADGHFYLWNEDHARSSHYEPPFIDHPFLDESDDFEDVVGPYRDEALPEMVAFLDAVWGMDLAVGDEFLMVSGSEALAFGVNATLVLEVAGAESLTVGAGTFDGLRLVAEVRLDFPLLGTLGDGLRLGLGTMWLDEETLLPLRWAARERFSLDASDLAPLLEFGSLFLGDDVELPKDFQLGFSFAGTLELESLEGDLSGSAVYGLAGLLAAAMAPLALVLSLGLVATGFW
ncbi:MAG TPA: hypothetical protein VI796_01430 [Candidatus Thermoplasmatota archaeon]|nr:hypothetical protein [Candidatus Thermoplasmatota archaeon]